MLLMNAMAFEKGGVQGCSGRWVPQLPAVCRRHLFGVSLLASLVISASVKSAAPDDSVRLSAGVTPAADAFARRLADDARELLFEAACIDPVTHEENRGRFEDRRESQKRLREWFDAHDRSVDWGECRTEQDRRNYLDFKTVMADEKLLALSCRKRLRIVRRAEDYFSDFGRLFARSSTGLLGCIHARVGRECVAAQLRDRLHVKARFFGTAAGRRIAALYVPSSRTVWFDLNRLASAPEEFTDAFEHELWHHLLPLGEVRGFAGNIWCEGFNEAVCEAWSDEFRTLRGARDARNDTVEYPVQTALASLCLGTAKAATVSALAAGVRPAVFAEKQAPSASEGMTVDSEGALAEALQSLGLLSYRIEPDERQRVESVLGGWGWREDDGDRISVEYLIALTGELDAETINAEFRSNRRFLRAFVDALSVVRLQSTLEYGRESLVLAGVDVPPILKTNLRRVLRYVKRPDYKLASN